MALRRSTGRQSISFTVFSFNIIPNYMRHDYKASADISHGTLNNVVVNSSRSFNHVGYRVRTSRYMNILARTGGSSL